MKKRVIALALCLVMLATCLGAGVFAPTPVALVDENGAAATSAAVPQLGRKTLTASYADATETTGYQWQFSNDGDTWIDIYGETAQTCSLSYAKVKNMLDADGKSQLRCVVTDGEDERISSAATVTVDYSAPASQPAVQAKSAPARAASYNAPAAPLDAGEHTNYSVVINYVFADGTQAANPWTANIAKGSSINQTVTSPTVLGYAPDQAEVVVNVTDIQDTVTYKVTYYPAEVEFTVKHYQQNVSNDYYTLSDTDTTKGYTESAVGENLAKNYEGFYSLLYDTSTEIAADGSTVVEIYYDRYYYLMSFDLDGGYGVEPIYARYGAPIGDVGTPTKAGYNFTGWDKTIPETMPAKNSTYTAQWSNGNSVSFTVVFWYENADDDGYSYVGSATKTAKVGTSVNSASYKDTTFTNRDDTHFTYNSAKAETVTVAGDGSTVLNVYFTRNTYTLTFEDGNIKIVCGKVEHEHSHEQCCTKTGWHLSCNSNKCPVGYEHEHTTGGWGTESCYKISDLTITAKYQADIHSNFPIKDGNDTIWWDVPNGCESFKAGTMLGSIDTMPGENITFTKAGTQSGAVLYYYIETLNGETGTYTQGGKSFKLYKQITLDRYCRLTYSEEFHPITGFTQWWSDPEFDKMEQGGVAYEGISGNRYYIKAENYLCYTRNSYTLSFYNYNAELTDKSKTVQYEAPLSGYNFEPSYPDKLESNAYKFAGWYTSPGCYDGSEVNWDTATMPANDLMLYAKWVPVTHTVKTWLTDEMTTPVNVGDTVSNEQTVPHGSTATEPAEPKNGKYTFVGWFYKENGVEKAFDFSMPVKKDLDLYAKWRSDVMVDYTIKYAVDNGDGTLTYIADETKGKALAFTTKTFEAKTGTQLNEGYQSGYFPTTNSHSMTMDIDGNNEYTFVYVPKEEVPYTVRYLEQGTGTQLVDPKNVKTRDAIITETFKPVEGYAPDAYQKRLVLSANEEENVITFWYTKDDVHAPVQIIHWIQNIAGDGYTEYQSSTNLNGVIGNPYSETPLTIAGFEYNSDKSNASGELTEAGLVLNLYYDRVEYPYEFRFLEQGTDNVLEPSATGTARYQAQVTYAAKPILGYTLVSAANQAINIAIEDPADTANKNVRVFYYTENEVTIKYQVVGPDGCGTVSPTSETLKVLTGTASGSTATANAPTFRFVGWYDNEACTGTALSTEAKYVPQKGSNGIYAAATYYAKFEYNLTDLTITKTASPYDANDMFIFTVKDSAGKEVAKVALKARESVTIKNLTVGETYTVTEDTGWSWRYSPDEATHSITLQPSDNVVTVTNTLNNNNWLGASSYAINQCVKSVANQVNKIIESIFGN